MGFEVCPGTLHIMKNLRTSEGGKVDRSIFKIAAVCCLLALVGIVGCASTTKTVQLMQFVPAGEYGNVQEKSGVKFEVNPLDETTLNKFPELRPKIKVTEKGLFGPTEKEVPVYLLQESTPEGGVPYVQARVTVTNRTGHVLRFTGSVIKLMDDMGNVYNALTKQEVIAGQSEALHRYMRRLRYLTPNTEVLPDMTWTGYIAFNMKMEEVAEIFKIAIYDLTTKTDAAGNPTEKSRFEFNFRKKLQTKTE